MNSRRVTILIFSIALYVLLPHICISDDNNNTEINVDDGLHQKAKRLISVINSIDWQQPDSTIHYLKQLENIEGIENYPEYLTEIKYYYSRAYRAQGEYTSAIENAMESYKLSESIRDTMKAARSAYQYGIMNLFIGNMDESLNYLSLSYNYYSSLGSNEDIADLNNALASYYIDNGNSELALERYNLALDTYTSINDSTGIANVNANLALVYIDEKEFDKAEYHLRQQGKIDSLQNSDYGLGFYYDFMGYLKHSEERYDQALYWYTNAVAIRSKLSSHYNRCESNLSMGQVLFDIKRYEEAIPYASEIFKYKDAHQSLSQEKRAHKILANSYEELGNLGLALKHYKDYKTVNDSMYNESKISAIAQSEAKLKKADLDRQIELLNKENELSELKVSKQKTLIGFSIFGLLLLGIVSLLIGKLYQNIKIKNKQINTTLKDKEILLREIHHRVKNNLQVISSLLSLQSRQIDNIQIQNAINEGRNRVRSMALIHQNLYQNENLTGVNVHSYLDKLVSELLTTYKYKQNNITLELNIENLNLDVDTMIPLGLIINELVSNSLKHAFEDYEKGIISIVLNEINDSLVLKVSDNGKGMDGVDLNSKKSFGVRLIKAFSQKLKADLRYETDNGTHITMIINKYLKAA